MELLKLDYIGNDLFGYFPFYEAVEFENLLSQGKSCLDCFSKAIGCMYDESPNKIDKLLNVLRKKEKNDKLQRLIDTINNANRLLGVVIDPKVDKKSSIRDLIIHRERADIYFTIRKGKDGNATLSEGALLNMRHPEVILLPNYRVTNISAKIHAILSGVIEKSFKILFDS